MKFSIEPIKNFFRMEEEIITFEWVHKVLIAGTSTFLGIVSVLLGIILFDPSKVWDSIFFSAVMLAFSFIPFIFIRLKKLYISAAVLLFGVNFVIMFRGLIINSAYMFTFLSLILILSGLIANWYVTILLFIIDMLAIILAIVVGVFTLDQPVAFVDGRDLYFANTVSDLLPNIIVGFIIAIILQWIFDNAIKKQQAQFKTLKKTQEKLIRQEKLESIQTLAGGVAHDFNNLLTSIIGVLSYATECIDFNDDDLNLLKEAENAALQAQKLTKQLLSFSKDSQPFKEIVEDVGDFIKNVVQFSSRGSNIVPQLDVSENLYSMEVDKGHITQVIQNLVINSIQAMPDGGILNIRLKNHNVEESNENKLPSGKYINIVVSDTGLGIPLILQERIFQPFFTTKSEGSGLGLHIVKVLISNHEGIIQVKSEENKGTTFSIFLPAIERKFKENDNVNENRKEFSGNVLVMDDDEKIQNILRVMLSKFGFTVILTSNTEEAVSKFRDFMKNNEKIDLAFLDMTIPGGKGGRYCFEEIKKLDPDIKIIFSSGYTSDEIPDDIMDLETVHYLRKPYTVSQLSSVLSKLLKK